MQSAWLALKHAAQKCAAQPSISELEDEYQNLFIGLGRGEVVPFASWHQTGSLMEKPLAHIRHDLNRLGFERDPSVKEPEDHISALCDVMAQLVTELEAVQQVFFNRHISPWFKSFTLQIEQAESTDFYRSVAKLTDKFLTLEQVRFSENKNNNKTHMKVDVKNVTEYE
jgi:TorA maturation chaperone TorD